jgi:hypothetical protein
MIPNPYRENFNTLHRAFDDDAACLLECDDLATGKPAYVICAVNRRGPDYELVPFARLFDGNPYDQLSPPFDTPENANPAIQKGTDL